MAEASNEVPERTGRFFLASRGGCPKKRATSPSCPKNVLEALVQDENINVRCEALQNKNLPIDILNNVLKKLAESGNCADRELAAGNDRCPVELLKQLGADKDKDVRATVACNENCPTELLELLARDSVKTVRYCVARNSNCPVKALHLLARDEDYEVRRKAVYNPNIFLGK